MSKYAGKFSLTIFTVRPVYCVKETKKRVTAVPQSTAELQIRIEIPDRNRPSIKLDPDPTAQVS